MNVYGNLTLVSGEIINFYPEEVTADPAFLASEEGRVVYNSTDNSLKFNNGTAWVSVQTSATSSNSFLETLGTNWINPNLTFNPTDFNALDNVSGLSTNDSLFDVIDQLDDAITSALNVVTLRGINLNFTSSTIAANNILYYDGLDFVPGTINDLDTIELDFDELQNVNVPTPSDRDFIIYDSDNSEYINKQVFYKQQFLSGTVNVFTVNHNLGEQFCHVTVIDNSFSPPRRLAESDLTSIQYSNANTLTVTTTTNKPVTIVVSSLEGI
jgi:hypothetical protein